MKSGDYTFYILNFVTNEQIDLAVSTSSQDVLILEDNSTSGFNSNSGSGSSSNKEEFDEQLADSLIRDSNFAPTTGAKLIKSEKIESIPNFITNAYTYRDSDMMWIFFVRKSIKTGQYEVSNRPFANVVDSAATPTPTTTLPTQLPAKFAPSTEQLKADALVRANQWAPTLSAKLIRIESSGSDSVYENYVYTYNDSDMMWAFFVRKNIKTGQYEVSNQPFPVAVTAKPQPTVTTATQTTTTQTTTTMTPVVLDLKVGGQYELTQQQIDNDFYLAQITQKINRDFASTLGRNAKLLKVLYQATNQLIYLITFETPQKTQFVYRATVDAGGNFNVSPVDVPSNPSSHAGPDTVDVSSQRAVQIVHKNYAELLGANSEVILSTSKAVYSVTIYQIVLRNARG